MFVASILSQKPYVLTLPNFHCVFACHLVVTWFSEDSAISYLRISGFVNDVIVYVMARYVGDAKRVCDCNR